MEAGEEEEGAGFARGLAAASEQRPAAGAEALEQTWVAEEVHSEGLALLLGAAGEARVVPPEREPEVASGLPEAEEVSCRWAAGVPSKMPRNGAEGDRSWAFAGLLLTESKARLAQAPRGARQEARQEV